MAHPFFEAVAFPWHLPEAKELHRVLIQAVPKAQQITLFYQQCGGHLSPLNPAQPPDALWNDALNNLVVGGALEKLCDILLADFKGNSVFCSAILAVINALPAGRVQVIRKSSPLPILDRENFREKLILMEDDDHPFKVLLVRGGKASGKSHSRHLFELAARQRGAIPVYLCDGLVVTVEDVVGEIFTAFQATDEIVPRDTTEDAWYRAICRKMLDVALRKNQSLWIAVDDLGLGPDGGPLLDTRIRKFCDQIAMSMVNPPFRQHFRLLLIDYPPGEVPSKWKSEFWDEDITDATDVRASHVSDLLTWWAAQRQKTLLDSDLQRSTEQVMNAANPGVGAPVDQRPPLRRMYDELVGVLKNI